MNDPLERDYLMKKSNDPLALLFPGGKMGRVGSGRVRIGLGRFWWRPWCTWTRSRIRSSSVKSMDLNWNQNLCKHISGPEPNLKMTQMCSYTWFCQLGSF